MHSLSGSGLVSNSPGELISSPCLDPPLNHLFWIDGVTGE